MANLVISTKSWHYRLLDTSMSFFSVHNSNPRTLCGYFWSWVWYVPWFIIFGTSFIATIVGLVALIPGLLWSWLHNHSHISAQILAGLACVVLLIVVVTLVAMAFKAAGRRVDDISIKDTNQLSAGEVVVKTMVATKRKLCPFITYQ
jgi:hypothetical protein